MQIGGLQKTTLIDYPGKIAAIVFTQGCNFRCPYCHNPELVKVRDSQKALSSILEFLKKRKGMLEGVVITGGEPTLQKDLKDVAQQIKNIGYDIKLDTNGTNPEMLKDLINSNLINYVAMDIKAPFRYYSKIAGHDVDIEKIKQSVYILMSSSIDYEFRTTVLKKLLSIEDLIEIGNDISGAKKYYLQRFVSTKILDETLIDEKNYSPKEFEDIAEVLRKKIEYVGIR